MTPNVKYWITLLNHNWITITAEIQYWITISIFIAIPVFFKLLSSKVLFINKNDYIETIIK